MASFSTRMLATLGFLFRRVGIAISGLEADEASAPTITAGTAAPTATEPAGSLYIRVSGTVGVYQTTGGGSWTLRLGATLNGNLTGNVTGNLTGNVTGNVTGDLTGNSAGTHTGAVVGSTGSFSGTLTLSDGSLLQRPGAGTGTGDVIEVQGPDATHGWKLSIYEATVSPAAVETALLTVPANSCIDHVQANIESALTGGGTTVTASIGITGDVDAYGSFGAPTDLLAKNSKLDWMGRVASGAGASLGVFSKSTVALKLIGAATGGDTAGDTALTVGSVKVRVTYRTLMSYVDAA